VKISLLPLYSQLNAGPGGCPLRCQSTCLVDDIAPKLKRDSLCRCPLSSHQATTYAQIKWGDAEIIFNTSATGDGKSLAANLPGLIDRDFRLIELYPTIELVLDQEQQIKNYHSLFGIDAREQVDILYGTELARRVEQAEKGNKFKELRRVFQQKPVILTNPDIFHLVMHFRYRNPAYSQIELPHVLATNPDLYVADEFHIFGVHQEAAILNSLIFIRRYRQRKRPLRVLFTSATPKPNFIDKLKQAGFGVAEIAGNYASEPLPGYRQISQAVELEFVELKNTDSFRWLTEQADTIREILSAEKRGRGLIILNSVAKVSRTVRQMQELLSPDVIVKEISGRITRRERAIIQEDLKNAAQPVLIVGTSAVDVGVDFVIHLLVFETSDSATFIQRLGRLGRHPGFSSYKAFVLLSERTPWIMARLREKLEPGESVDRIRLREIIEEAIDPPSEFEQYRNYWGALQAQGMLVSMSRGNTDAMQSLIDRMSQDLRRVYGEQLDKKRGQWFALGKEKPGAAIQNELLRFRGGSDLQAAVWDNDRFYTYDLLRLLPYVEVAIIERETFLDAAKRFAYSAIEFPDKYIQVYLKVEEWVDQRVEIELECDKGTDELKQGTLTLIDKLSITGHTRPEVGRCLRKQKLLAFLVKVNRHQRNSHWDISQRLHLSPMFGLYRLTDADGEVYACAFNQDALLLESLKWRLSSCAKTKSYIF